MLYLDCFLISLPPQKRWDIQQILGIRIRSQAISYSPLTLIGGLIKISVVGI